MNPKTKESNLENQEEEKNAKLKLTQINLSLSKPIVIDADPRKKALKKLLKMEIVMCTKVELLRREFLKFTAKCQACC